MNRRALGFWAIADRESARVFGRRHWRWFVGIRILRSIRKPAVVGIGLLLVSGLAVWLVRSGFRIETGYRIAESGFRLGRIPDWIWVAVLVSGLSLVLVRKPVRKLFRTIAYKIGI